VVVGNAAKHANIPTQTGYEAKPLTAEQANELLETVKDHDHGALFVIALALDFGMARSTVCVGRTSTSPPASCMSEHKSNASRERVFFSAN
jgi:hypothetical protein